MIRNDVGDAGIDSEMEAMEADPHLSKLQQPFTKCTKIAIKCILSPKIYYI